MPRPDDYARRAHIWAMTDFDGDTFGAGGEVDGHAMAQDRPGQRHDVVDRRREAALDDRAGAAGQHEGLAGARARTPGDALAHDVEVGVFGTAGAHQLQDGVDDAFADRQAPHQRLGGHQVARRQGLRGDGRDRRRWCRS